MGKVFGNTRIFIPHMTELKNIPVVIKVGGKLIEDILGDIKEEVKKQEGESKRIDEGSVKRVVVTDMENIRGEVLEDLKAGDVVVKEDSTGAHAYLVSFRSDTGICITYTDCENVETVAYDKIEGVWTFNSKDVTHIGS